MLLLWLFHKLCLRLSSAGLGARRAVPWAEGLPRGVEKGACGCVF